MEVIETNEKKLSLAQLEFIVACLQARYDIDDECAKFKREYQGDWLKVAKVPEWRELSARRKGLTMESIARRCCDEGPACEKECVCEGVPEAWVRDVVNGNYAPEEAMLAARKWRQGMGLNRA